MSATAPRVVLLVLDSFPPEATSPGLTPHLWGLSEAYGYLPGRGVCALPASTYPSHATLISGHLPHGNGVRTNRAASPERGGVPGWAGQTQVMLPTLFDACRASGLRCAAILGDQHLYKIMRADVADLIWPAGGVLAEGTPRDPFGYAADVAVRPHLIAAAADSSLAFVFGHLNEPDTFGHILGPDHPTTRERYRAADAIVGELIETLQPDWERSVLIVISDHAMEPLTNRQPIDLRRVVPVADMLAEVIYDGGCCLIRPRPGVSVEELVSAVRRVDGVIGCAAHTSELALAAAAPGRIFAEPGAPLPRGFHGGPDTAHTLAVVGGGHPAVAALLRSVARRPPHLADWAPTIAGLLGLPFRAEGDNLLGHASGSPQ